MIMSGKLKNILGMIALVLLFTACSKDSDMMCGSTDNTELNEKAATSEEVDTDGKPIDDSSESLPPEDTGNDVDTDADHDGISDDDDDESDDDSSLRQANQ